MPPAGPCPGTGGNLVIGKGGKTGVATLAERSSLVLVPLHGRDSLTVGPGHRRYQRPSRPHVGLVDPAPTRATSAELSYPQGRIHRITPASTGVGQPRTAGRKIRATSYANLLGAPAVMDVHQAMRASVRLG